jgi:polyphenol oxidase
MNALSQETLWLQVDGWRQFPGLVHGFSSHLYNREEALANLDADRLSLHTLKQVHGDRIVTISRQSSPHDRTEADGLISAEPGTLLGIATADCVPVFMVEPQKGVAAALHAGWRGTLKGIASQAVALLASKWQVDPKNLHVALGPSIGSCCYEVGSEVGESIVSRWDIRSASAWRPVGEKGFLDLREVNTLQLAKVGVPQTQIAHTGPCTFCHSTFASYRRDGVAAGRQLSVIGWLNT